jgi:transcriptional regulator with XRE-family HTH domain
MEQKELAAKTGLSLKTIENYVKKDSSVPAADKAVLIARALGITVEDLVSGRESAKTSGISDKNREIMSILTKLDDYNYEILASIAKTLLKLQGKKKD